MDPSPERRRYYPDEENVPLSVSVREALEDHEQSSLDADELELYNHINPDAIDELFRDAADLGVIVQINLSNVIVSIWSDGGINIRVTDEIEEGTPE